MGCLRSGNICRRTGVYRWMMDERRQQRAQRTITYCGWLIVTASLWALVYCMAHSRRFAPPQGVAVVLLRSCTRAEEDNRGDSRDIWVRLRVNGRTFINEREIESSTLRPFIEHEMSTRWEKVIYLLGEHEIPYQRVAEVGADLQQAVPDMYIFLATTSNVRPQFPCLVPATSAPFRPDDAWNGSLSQPR